MAAQSSSDRDLLIEQLSKLDRDESTSSLSIYDFGYFERVISEQNFTDKSEVRQFCIRVHGIDRNKTLRNTPGFNDNGNCFSLSCKGEECGFKLELRYSFKKDKFTIVPKKTILQHGGPQGMGNLCGGVYTKNVAALMKNNVYNAMLNSGQTLSTKLVQQTVGSSNYLEGDLPAHVVI